jgi:OOP family OmpA-OmpF porin
MALGLPAQALVLDLPGPVLSEEARLESPGSYGLPTAPFDGTALPLQVLEGAVDQRAYRLDLPGATTLAVLAPLRDQLVAAGFQVILDCAARDCGGFDFRYATEVLPEPDMHVDLGDFRFLSATRGDEAVTLLVSRSDLSAYVQITRVQPMPDAPAEPAKDAPRVDLDAEMPRGLAPGPAASAIARALDQDGTAILDDLAFAIGAASLASDEAPSLAAVAAWLQANPDATIALVGHTDASGSLAANIALSDRRAEAVAQVLIDRYGVDRARVAAEGVGFLAPRASNQTEAGREENRRVEVIVTSTPPAAP